MVSSCSTPGAISIARRGGMIHTPSSVRTRITPSLAYSSWTQGWQWASMVSPWRAADGIAVTRRGSVSNLGR
jgi:hypothetical protein